MSATAEDTGGPPCDANLEHSATEDSLSFTSHDGSDGSAPRQPAANEQIKLGEWRACWRSSTISERHVDCR